MKSIVQDAKRDGYVKTLLNRRRYTPDVPQQKLQCEKLCGTDCDELADPGQCSGYHQTAMVNYAKDEKQSFNAELLLQIHDELIFDVPEMKWKSS